MTDAERDDDGGVGWSDPDASGGDDRAGGGQDDGGGEGGADGAGIKLPRHDFVTRLVKDPSNVSEQDALVLLNGFAGDSDEDGYTRLYCEPTLEHYTDVKDEDVLHYEEDPIVGYRVWARRDAQVRQGQRGHGKGEPGSFFSGPLLTDYRQGTGGQGTGNDAQAQTTVIGPTGWHYCTLVTCPPTQHLECTYVCPLPSTTRCLPPTFECPPGQGGGTQPADTAARMGPTGWLGCTQPGHCVGQTGWQGCTHLLGCPRTSTCPPQGGGTGDALGAQGGGGQNTAATVCTQVGCHPIGVTGWYGCHQPTHTLATVCTQIGCGHTHLLGCPSTSTCPPQGGGTGDALAAPQGGHGTIHPTIWTQIGCSTQAGCIHPTIWTQIGCGPGPVIPQGGGQSTAATTCTQIGCHPIGITGWYGCHQPTHTLATVCTQVGCGQTHLLGCPSTSTCPPQGGGTGDAPGAAQGGQSTAATLCTQVGCGHGTIHPTIWTQIGCSTQAGCIHPTLLTQIGCGPGPVIPQGGAQGGGQSTAATVCTQIGCGHTHLLGCPRTSDCPPTWMPGCPSTSTCTPQGGGAPGLAAAPGGAQSTAATLCTQIGCDPTAATHCFICPPRTVDCPVAAAAQGGAQSTAATLCTQIGCDPTAATHCFICPPRTSDCPVAAAPGGAQAAAAGPQTYAPGCTLGFTCTYVGCPGSNPQGTAATVCTQLGCGYTHMPGCPSSSTCPPHGTVATVGCPGPRTYSPGCTLGFTCTYVGCPR